jgi:hypothetical protein
MIGSGFKNFGRVTFDMVIKICFSKMDDGKDIIGRWIF